MFILGLLAPFVPFVSLSLQSVCLFVPYSFGALARARTSPLGSAGCGASPDIKGNKTYRSVDRSVGWSVHGRSVHCRSVGPRVVKKGTVLRMLCHALACEHAACRLGYARQVWKVPLIYSNACAHAWLQLHACNKSNLRI